MVNWTEISLLPCAVCTLLLQRVLKCLVVSSLSLFLSHAQARRLLSGKGCFVYGKLFLFFCNRTPLQWCTLNQFHEIHINIINGRFVCSAITTDRLLNGIVFDGMSYLKKRAHEGPRTNHTVSTSIELVGLVKLLQSKVTVKMHLLFPLSIATQLAAKVYTLPERIRWKVDCIRGNRWIHPCTRRRERNKLALRKRKGIKEMRREGEIERARPF